MMYVPTLAGRRMCPEIQAGEDEESTQLTDVLRRVLQRGAWAASLSLLRYSQ